MKEALIIFGVGVALCIILAIGVVCGGYKYPEKIEEDQEKDNMKK